VYFQLERSLAARAVAELRLVRPMKIVLTTLLAIGPVVAPFAQQQNDDQQVRAVVQSFYAAFNSHGWKNAESFATEDWNHINPLGGWTRGRAAVLKELEQVHSSFLKGVSDTIQDMAVSFASPDVAVVTVTSRMSTFTTPDGVRHENEQHIRTFVVVKRAGRWLIMQDQNTAVVPPKA
jgi:uncharacterized protein (TIGR02246 family)